MSTILVTGGSGFIGQPFDRAALLAAGHQVRTTVRNLKREGDVRGMLKEGGTLACDRLTFIAADLENDTRWSEAVAGCEYVLHVASPFPPTIPKHEDELIVLCNVSRRKRCAHAAVSRKLQESRVVLTSSFAAIGYGQKSHNGPFNETDWTDPNGGFPCAARYPIEDFRRTCGLGFRRKPGRCARAVRRQPGRRVRASARPRLFDVDPAGAAPDGRRHARLPEALFWRRRCARCR